MRHPWANLILLVLLAAELLTGFGGLLGGADRLRWILWLHSAGAYAIVLLLFWKGQIIANVLSRHRRMDGQRVVFLLMTALTLLVIAAGLWWTWGGPGYVLGFSLMTIHAVLALGLLALLVWHTLARRFIFRVRYARDRRAFLRLMGLSVAGLALWQTARAVKTVLGSPGAQARFTGSYEAPGIAEWGTTIFPTVSWLFDNPAPIDVVDWRLIIEGAVERPLSLTYQTLQSLAAERQTAVLDCTGGWYAEQEWSGINMGRLLGMCGIRPTARSILVEAVSGYNRRFALQDAGGLLLALSVGGQVLDHGHGFPVRLVAPGQRGFAWVKWVTRIEVSTVSPLWQPPLPLQ
jgi:DMSO/TMAO reductase YedYZ molybdopterin-dependent catalytic subunit